MRARATVVILGWLVPLCVGIGFVFVQMPLGMGVEMAAAYDALGEGGWLLTWLFGWIVTTAGITLFEVWRLGSRERTGVDFPFSQWRTAKATLLAFGWVQVGTVVVSAPMAKSVSDALDGSPWTPGRLGIWLALAGLAALVAGAAMRLRDVVSLDSRITP